MTVLPKSTRDSPQNSRSEILPVVPAALGPARAGKLSAHDLTLAIKNAAREIGFDLVGIADVQASAHGDYIAEFFAQGRHGTMDYLARMQAAKMDIRSHLPWAVSSVCVAMSYHHNPMRAPEPLGESHPTDNAIHQPQNRPATNLNDRGSGEAGRGPAEAKIASYASGRDYHRIFSGLLHKLETAVRALVPGDITARAYVDTGPCLERELAMRAGLGWIGKNTMLIHPRHGSWFLLGELFLSVPLPADAPVPDRCGTCTRCIDACPTEALVPYRMDASKCISYLTLENRADIASEFHAPIRNAGYIIGCDICQSVCPFNRRPLPASHPDFQPRSISGTISPRTVLQWTPHDWDQATRGRAFRRAKLHMWQRNAAILL